MTTNRKKPRRRGRRLAIVLLVIAGVVGALLVDARQQLDAPMAIATPQAFEISPGSPLVRVVTDARKAGLFDSARQAFYLRGYARVTGQAAAVKAGEYELLPGITARDALALWVSGKTLQRELRVIEGWRFADALAQVRNTPELEQTLADASPKAVMAAIGAADVAPEGRLFPDTYRFPKGTSDAVVLRQARAAMDTVLAEEWAARAPGLPYATPEEALIMASIIEKETGQSGERAAIAGVFVRRLKIGMRLQTDPSVIYGLGPAYDGDIRSRDLTTDTPYNTYTRDGLPPTPICLPGRAALRAALHPADGDALYFVGRGDGTHAFSATLEEHNAAVRRYQLGGRSSRSDRASAP